MGWGLEGWELEEGGAGGLGVGEGAEGSGAGGLGVGGGSWRVGVGGS